MKLSLELTEQHILAGRQSSCSFCPFALALKDHGFQEVYVLKTVLFANGQRYKLSLAAKRFVKQFDATKTGTPGYYEITLVES